MRLQPVQPQAEFYQTESPHIKLYTGALPQAIKDILDRDMMNEIKLTQVTDTIQPSKIFYLFRHFESNYNTYKKRIQENPLYKDFLQTNNEQEQIWLAKTLLQEFLADVKIDYHTPLSPGWIEQAEYYGKLYGELFSWSPELFPDKIMISPYTRTKHTAHALLKNLEWLDMDIDFLLKNDDFSDMKVGTLQWKPLVITLNDEIRERDFGNMFGPWYIRDLMKNDTLESPITHIEKEKSHYYTSTHGGESQFAVNERAKNFLHSITDNDRYKTRMLFTHHLFILWAIKNIFGGSFNTFYNLDMHRKPKNGWMTTLVEIPQSEDGISTSAKLRVAWYNFLPSE